MIGRYLIVLTENPGDRLADIETQLDRFTRARDLHLQIENSRFRLFTDRALDAKLGSDTEYFVIGDRFDRLTGRPIPAHCRLPSRHGADCINEVLASSWGSYLLAVYPAGGTLQLVRSACGDLPCYYARHRERLLLASHARDLAALQDSPAMPDWPTIAHHLWRPSYRTVASCIDGIEELPGGASLEWKDGEVRTGVAWSPWDHVAPQSNDSRQNLVDRIGRAVRHSVRALGARHDHVLLTASGGLDSSVVAACLAKAKVRTSLITFATKDPRGDERGYCELLAEHLRLPLIVSDEDASKVDIAASSSAHLPRPLARSFAQTGDAACQATAEEVGADAHFTGGGGDNAFCYLQSSSPVADSMLARGALKSLRTAVDMSRITGVSALTSIKMGVRRAARKPAGYRWPTDPSYLTDEALTLASGIRAHPWAVAPAGVLPGKAAHVATLLAIQNHLEGFGRELTLPLVSPLMTQPILEACLGVPSWEWCAGGIDRSIVREAFASELPSAILRRTSKGSPGAYVAEVFDLNRSKIRTLLGDGRLRQAGIIDFAAIEPSLLDGRPGAGGDHVRIMTLVDTEAWLCTWT